MAGGTHGNHPGTVRGSEHFVQSGGEREVSKEVRAELKLETLSCFLKLRDGHDASVVDQDMNWSFPPISESLDRPKIRKIEAPDVNSLVAGRLAQFGHNRFGSVGAADRKRH
jgi:hypothetical protein